MWKQLISRLTHDSEFSPAASEEAIADAERSLAIRFPEELRSFLGESNGARGPYGLGLIWSLGEIQECNQAFRRNADFRELYMPFEPLLFFGDSGNGDQFAYRILAGGVRDRDIYLWDHENDSRTWIAASLEPYLEQALEGYSAE